jgi:hypothetical protein
MKIHVISTGHNCADYVQGCIDSVRLQQSEVKATHWLMSDASTDETAVILCRNHRAVGRVTHTRSGAAYHRWNIIQNPTIQDEDIIVLLGMDDELLPGALQSIYDAHKSGAWVTYGNWKNQHGKMNTCPLEHNNQTRVGPYVFTAPNSFRAGLYRRIEVDRLKVFDEWQHVCTEVEVMYSCVEMAGWDRLKAIKEPIYMYRQKLPTGTLAVWGYPLKQKVLKEIQARPKQQRIDSL